MVVFTHVHHSLTSLHNRCFMSQAKWMQHLGKAWNKCEAWDEGRRKTSPLLWPFRPPTPTSIDWRRWCQKDQSKHNLLFKNCHLSGWGPETPITTKNTGNKCEGKIILNNVRLSAAKVRLAWSKFSYVQTQMWESKEGKRVVQTNSKVRSLWVMFGLSTLNLKKLVNQAFS